MWSYPKADPPDGVSVPILDVGFGFGFALKAMRAAGLPNLRGIEVSEQQAAMSRKAGFEAPAVEN